MSVFVPKDLDRLIFGAVVAVGLGAMAAAFSAPAVGGQQKGLAFVESGIGRAGSPVYVDKRYSALKARLCKARRIEHWNSTTGTKTQVVAHRCPWQQI